MAASTAHTIDEEGRRLLEKIQKAFSDGKVAAKPTEEDSGNVKYTNASLDAYVLPLLQYLDLNDLGYTAWKISNRITIKNATGPEYIIPITDISNTARLFPGHKLQSGLYVYHTETVDLLPSLVCLFVTKPGRVSQ
ncbi:hypothetical protein TEQG_07500 [Trichophyton equinum CBS 127.97]|uniref:Uncharacterized protein n=1 Tax=Trichophyton equinum (strain ATCC MYA-4606 / CBS 127.97) TaxID=559882 RepID=F2Q2M5_TRIEC|nr:hypothetical protein TEQG_07500 [Trichophyton equinum CBS 127.97]